MKTLNFGSINIDSVYTVPHIVKPGETVSSFSLSTNAGGKGANQSAALAKAGTEVYHAGKIGQDGLWIKEKLRCLGVNTDHIVVGDLPTGNAMIQVADDGENSIVLFGGGNKDLTEDEVRATLTCFSAGDILLLQNEINLMPFIIEEAAHIGMKIIFNPAPFSPTIFDYPLDQVDTFIVNEIEGSELSHGKTEIDEIIEALGHTYPQSEIILTLGEKGVVYWAGQTRIDVPAYKVKAVDTTAAGDTFIGYYIAGYCQGLDTQAALKRACLASSITVSRPGATDSIPSLDELG